MKFFHLSDLHLGKRHSDFSLIEDQRYILNEIISLADSHTPDGVIIAGDVYDKTVPSAEAVELFDSFLVALAERQIKVFIISGNHDSPERVAFGGEIMQLGGVYLSPVYNGKVEPVCLADEYGEIKIWLLPFLKPILVRRHFPEKEIETYTDALAAAIDEMGIDPKERNLLVTHQFVTGADKAGSEELSVGGSDNVDITVFRDFDYVALGHIHSAQNLDGSRVRYCGTPLKYSFSEIHHKKSVTLLAMGEKGALTVEELPLAPLRDLEELKGDFETLRSEEFRTKQNRENYFRIILTDEEDIMNAYSLLSVHYPRIMSLQYDNSRTRAEASDEIFTAAENLSPFEMFAKLFALQNGRDMNENEIAVLEGMIDKIWKED